jgi:cobalamin biosynthesis Co2+ chelatase CbiK
MKKGLLLIAHGTKSDERNRPLSDFMISVCSEYQNHFDYCSYCFLESTPSISESMEKIIEKGITNCLVIPLFTAPSAHYNYDIPQQLAPFTSDQVVISISSPYFSSRQFNYSLLEQVKELSVMPEEECIILFAHGSSEFNDTWNRMLNETGIYLIKNTGIPVYNFAYIKNGKYFPKTGKELIEQELQSVNRLIILGVYLSKSIFEIYYKYKEELPKYFDKYRNEGRISFSKKSLLSGNFVKLWISGLVSDYLNSNGNNPILLKKI